MCSFLRLSLDLNSCLLKNETTCKKNSNCSFDEKLICCFPKTSLAPSGSLTTFTPSGSPTTFTPSGSPTTFTPSGTPISFLEIKIFLISILSINFLTLFFFIIFLYFLLKNWNFFKKKFLTI